jgi:hypothetical protein
MNIDFGIIIFFLMCGLKNRMKCRVSRCNYRTLTLSSRSGNTPHLLEAKGPGDEVRPGKGAGG